MQADVHFPGGRSGATVTRTLHSFLPRAAQSRYLAAARTERADCVRLSQQTKHPKRSKFTIQSLPVDTLDLTTVGAFAKITR